MSGVFATIDPRELGVKVNKDLSDKILASYKVHKAGTSRGHGLFAKRNISKDLEIIRVTGPKISPDTATILYFSYGIDVAVQVGKNSWILPSNESRFINHSCEPTMGFKENGVFVARRNIKKGEELTYDYSTNDIGYLGEPDWAFNCMCGSMTCRGKVSNLDILNSKYGLAEKYKRYLPPFVRRTFLKK